MVILTKQRKYNKYNLKLNNSPLYNTQTTKILGIIFASKNIWLEHLKEITKINMNIIKSLTHTTWEVNTSSLKQICKLLMLSKLKYWSFLYVNTKETTLKMIETIYTTSLRLATGVFRSSPILRIQNLAYTPRLENKMPYLKKSEDHKLILQRTNIT